MRSFLLLGAGLAAALSGCGSPGLDLPESPVERAATCGVVAAIDAREKLKTIQGALPLEAQGHIIHYAMLAASEGPQFAPSTAAEVVKLMPELEGRISKGKWKELQEPCAQAFPATVASGPITLPSDPLEAELGCNGVAAFLGRAVQNSDEAALDQITKYNDMRAKLDDQIAVKLKARGQSSFEQIQEARQKAMAGAVKLGPPIELMKVCLARYG